MTAAAKPRKWTVDEFLVWHERQEERYELVGGYPVLKHPPVRVQVNDATQPTMMTGANRQHNEVNAELLSILRSLLRDNPCRAYANDAAVRTSANQIRYPDVVIDCGTRADEGYLFEHAVLIAEILSPSTKSFDLTVKIAEYWGIVTLKYVLIVDPETRRAQLHSRGMQGAPTVQLFDDPDDTIDLPDLDISFPIARIFAGLPPFENREANPS